MGNSKSRREFLGMGVPLAAAGVAAVLGMSSPKAKTLVQLGGAPTPNDNTDHVNRYLTTLTMTLSPNISSPDQNVDAQASLGLLQGSFTPSAGFEAYTPGIIAGFNYRKGTITVDSILDVWWESSTDGSAWTQRSAKYPLSLQVLYDAVKRPFSIGVPMGSTAHRAFWNSTTSTIKYLRITAQRQANGIDAATATIIISDIYFDVQAWSRDIP